MSLDFQLQGQHALLERLLQGAFICKTTDEDGWRSLQTPAVRQHIEQYLIPLNRTLSTASDGQVFYCSYIQLGDPERVVLSRQFKEICSALGPLVQWLLIVQDTTGDDMPLTEGCTLRLSNIQSRIEDTPALQEQLAKLAQTRLFGSNSNQLDSQIKLIFRRLTEMGYLLRPNPEKLIYQATGKIDYLYEVIQFIDETEGLQLEVQAETASQTDLLLGEQPEPQRG